MRGDPDTMTVMRPRRPAEAIAALDRHPDAVPLAGGTDFMVSWNAGQANNNRILDLSSIRSWRRIAETGTGLRIGSLVTHWQIQQHGLLTKRFPLLVQAAATIGGRQIQGRGTLGGNIANASPAGDTFPPLAVYDACVQLASVRGRRMLPILEVFAGVKRTTIAPGELITSVEIDFPKPRPYRSLFRKVGTRAASAISKTVVAGLMWRHRDGRVRELRFALGSMAPTVRRLPSVEDYVRGKKLTSRVVEGAVRLLEEDVSPIDDLRSTRLYRLEVSKNLLRDFLSG